MRVFADSKIQSEEIKSWVKKYHPMLAHAQKVVVLGCGSGRHLSEILNQYPNLVIEVLDLDSVDFFQWKNQDLRGNDAQQIGLVTEQSASRQALILEYKSAWGSRSMEYALIAANLKDADLGNIKNICHNLVIQDQGQDAKIWRALREMVK